MELLLGYCHILRFSKELTLLQIFGYLHFLLHNKYTVLDILLFVNREINLMEELGRNNEIIEPVQTDINHKNARISSCDNIAIALEKNKNLHHLTILILSSLKWNVDSVVDNRENQPFVTLNFFFMRLNCFSENYQAFN